MSSFTSTASPPSYSPTPSIHSSSSRSTGAPSLASTSSSRSTSTSTSAATSFDLSPPRSPPPATHLSDYLAPTAKDSLDPHTALFSSPQVISQRGVFPADHAPQGRFDITKDAVHITLMEKFVFLHPPTICTVTGEVLRPGKDGRVNGFVHVTSSVDKTVQGVKVMAVGKQKLYFPSDGGRVEDSKTFRRELVLGGEGPDGVRLKAGLNSFEFSITIPASTATYNRTPCGSARHDIIAQLMGGKKGWLGRTAMEDEAYLKLVSVPSRDEGVSSLSLPLTAYHPSLGPFHLALHSSQLTVGAPLDVSLHLRSPPPDLTVFAVSVYVLQTVEITSSKIVGKSHLLTRGKAYAMLEGAEGPYDVKGAARRMRRKGVLWENGKEGGGEWRMERMARMPDDFHIRPTTHAGTISSLRVSNEILVDVVISLPASTPASEDETVSTITLLRRPIVICSCCAFPDSVTLPDYQPAEQRTFLMPTDPCPCVCNEPWEGLEKRELEVRKKRKEAELAAVDTEVLDGNGRKVGDHLVGDP